MDHHIPETLDSSTQDPTISSNGELPASPAQVRTIDSGYTSGDEPQPVKEPGTRDFLRSGRSPDTTALTDNEVVQLAKHGLVAPHALERLLADPKRAVLVRRQLVQEQAADLSPSLGDGIDIDCLPWEDYDYSTVAGRCAENVIGYMTVPVGVVGPFKVDGLDTFVPMSTTEGALIAGTSRGCKALNMAGGVTTELLGDAMTRAPCVRFSNIRRAAEAKRLIASEAMQEEMRDVFGTTTAHGWLLDVTPRMAGVYLHMRFRARSGEAMGMNMLSKGADAVLWFLKQSILPDMEIVALSGNTCTDKKPSAINWIEGRGKSVVAEAIIPAEVIATTLKTTVERVVNVNIAKNLVGSALAGTSTGGFNAHAANIVAAIYLATGQDIAQVVTSSNCLTMMERYVEAKTARSFVFTPADRGIRTLDGSLHSTVTMPSIEVGTVGGGTHLPAQASMLRLAGCGAMEDCAGDATRLASVVASTVLAGELNLCSALASQDLVQSHMALNRQPRC